MRKRFIKLLKRTNVNQSQLFILFQKGIVIIDSPGVGESDIMDEIVTQYLPQAFAFLYVINSANAGGVQKDRVSIAKTIFHPWKEVISAILRSILFQRLREKKTCDLSYHREQCYRNVSKMGEVTFSLLQRITCTGAIRGRQKSQLNFNHQLISLPDVILNVLPITMVPCKV